MRPDPFRNPPQQRGAPLDDAAMQQHMRALAVSLNPDSAASVKPCTRAALRAPLRTARTLAQSSTQLSSSLEWLIENGRLIEAFALSLGQPSSKRLPAVRGVPRITLIMRELTACSDSHITAERLCSALSAFDEVRALTMNELWSVPCALAAALEEEYLSVCALSVRAQKDCIAASRWMEEGAPLSPALLRRSSAFFECALKQMHEQDMPAKYQELTEWLLAHDRRAERIIALEHENQALLRLIMSSILSTLRLLSSLDWSKCFEEISQTEKILLRDPSGTYAHMDAPSRAQVRSRVTCIAKKCGMGEAAAAKCALDAAEECEDIRKELCWWLHTDAGMRALIKKIGIHARIRPLIPDPKGRKYMSAVLLSAAAVFVLCLLFLGAPALPAFSVLWGASAAAVHFIAARLRRPLPLLKLRLTEIPDECRTLVVMPALLSCTERAEELIDELETLGCLIPDKNISFLLLGDLSEHDAPEREGDSDIISAAQSAADRANERAGWEKYYFLHRPRVLQECEGRYMGRERKRGALADLNHLLTGGENRFAQSSAQALCGRFPFVITIDAGTRMLPDAVYKLIGAMAHPLNRPHREPDGRMGGYAILAPRMEQRASSAENRFIELYGGKGGIDSYPAAVSDVYQDLCGQGMFGGKGIYDAEAFEEALRGKLPDNAVLSHDMIEGILARCAFACDVTFYDAHPRSVRSYLMRLERWTRGDWQLLPLLFRRSLKLRALDRYKIIDNLRRSLVPLMQMLLFFLAIYSRSFAMLTLALAPQLTELVFGGIFTRDAWQRILVRISLLPQEAFSQTSAALRALWRMSISKKHLLQWVTADDADRRGGRISPVIGWTASILLLPALVAPVPWILLDVLLAALWWSAPALTDALEEPIEDHEPLDFDQKALLRDLAQRTFRFFTEYTPPTGLTPDNVQFDPRSKVPDGIARRTSPTNIGLYLASCVSARELGLIDAQEMHRRVLQTLISLEKMEKWRGQLYNWYHTDTLQPLRPRYVSSVDSGNLAACLMLCARSLEQEGYADTAQRMEALVKNMDFAALFDSKRKLFLIGMDVENDRLSGSHYDLMASESRILSFVAMMLGQIPLSHWAHLGRMTAQTARSQALISWSGTMFEYLMPTLFLPVYRNTLLHQTDHAVVDAQISHQTSDLPWGVSESGYYAFDLSLNYQYRAFGLPALALRGDAASQVIAPYASMLALPSHGEEVMENLRRMIDLDMMGEYGLYEAMDCAPERIGENARMKIVKSHMAHHQGMILCAVCNALTDNTLIRLFCDRPQARALTLLLEEKPAPKIRLSAPDEKQTDTERKPIPARTHRIGQFSADIPDTHLLFGSGTTALLTADGAAFVRCSDMLLNRRESEIHMPPQGMFIHVHDRTNDRRFLISGMKEPPKGVKMHVRFDAGSALYSAQTPQLSVQNKTFLSPEDGAFLQQITLTSSSAKPIDMEITGCFQPVLAREEDYTAHPVFQNLFLESSRINERTLCFRRRPRMHLQRDPLLIYQVCGAEDAVVSCETDMMRLVGRDRLMSDAHALPDVLSDTVGNVLTPCAALRLRFTLPPRGTQNICFCAGLVASDSADAFVERYSVLQSSQRASELAHTQCRELLRFLSLSAKTHHLLQKTAVLLLYPRLHAPVLSEPPAHDLRRSSLWPMGISGDLPIIAAHAEDAAALQPIRELIQAHEFYRSMGILCDLVLINDHGNDYEQPVRDRLRDLISGSHLCGLISAKGGVHLLDRQSLSEESLELLHLAAAFVIYSSKDTLSAQLTSALGAARVPLPPMPSITRSLPTADTSSTAAPNGFGAFAQDGYSVCRFPAPAPWCNILCNPHFGSMITERGGGFIWYENSRNGRVTPFDNDPMQEGWSDLLLLSTPDGRTYAPAYSCARVTHQQGCSRFEGSCDVFSWELVQFADHEMPVKCHHLTLTARRKISLRIQARIDFIVNVTRSGASLTARGFEGGLYWSRGEIGAMAFACFDSGSDDHSLRRHSRLEGGLLTAEITLSPDEPQHIDLLIGISKDMEDACSLLAVWHEGGGAQAHLRQTLDSWDQRLSRISLSTPHPLLDQMVNRWLPYQTVCGRIYARTGFYQAGGAFGFRDQLQDMLCMLLIEPEMVRRHLILCVAHQFESGDVQHWWHPESTGVRTHISDDLLFLPYVTAEYVQTTEDKSILEAKIPFLKDVPIPDGQEDWYGEAQPSEESASLHEHCLRAIRRACRLGQHSLMLMGSGDWNDGMNRVGHKGIGESIWLTEFMIVVLEKYAPLCDEETKEEFSHLASRLREAVELHGWDGKWYRRAYMDDGTMLGSAQSIGGCRIDSLSQSWAVLAGLSRDRVKTAMNEAEKHLIDRENGIIKLLTPPFDGESPDPGYIRGYPPGVRENGGQYTHAACWMVIALAELGLGDKAWEAFFMLLPFTHSDTEEKALTYRTEPYVIAADIYGEAPHKGRGGWTWYTGAAGWMVRAAYVHLMGLKIHGKYATLNALLPLRWDEASVTLRVGQSTYTLTAKRSCGSPLLDGAPLSPEGAALVDDGLTHQAVFPVRKV